MSDANKDKTNSSVFFAGYFFFWNNNIITATSMIQTINANNIKQNELYALHKGFENLSELNPIIEWDIKIMNILQTSQIFKNIQVYTDNQALMLGLNSGDIAKTIKGTIYFHNMFKQIVQGKDLFAVPLQFKYIFTKDNLADLLTKPLSSLAIQKNLNKYSN